MTCKTNHINKCFLPISLRQEKRNTLKRVLDISIQSAQTSASCALVTTLGKQTMMGPDPRQTMQALHTEEILSQCQHHMTLEIEPSSADNSKAYYRACFYCYQMLSGLGCSRTSLLEHPRCYILQGVSVWLKPCCRTSQ